MVHRSTQDGEQKVLLRVSVKSEDPNLDTSMLLDSMQNSQRELTKMLRKHAPVKNISLKRRGNLPIGIETAALTVLITVGKDIAEPILKKAAEDAYDWFKGKWKKATFRKISSGKKLAQRKRPKRRTKRNV